jgi:hypothetical protein
MSNGATTVCPVESSHHSSVSLGLAAAWARHFGAQLIVVIVLEHSVVTSSARG